jgi:hypothetical protein
MKKKTKGSKEMEQLVAWLEMKIATYTKEKAEWENTGRDEVVADLNGSIDAFEDTLAKAKEILNG